MSQSSTFLPLQQKKSWPSLALLLLVVGHVKRLSDEAIFGIANAENKSHQIPATTLKRFWTEAINAIPGTAPMPIDHRKAINPYLSKYGEANWEAEIQKHSIMSSYICITEVVKHIVTASAKLYKGTKYEKNWYFYHDALSLMTATATKEWMKKEKYFQYWLLPLEGINEDDPVLKPKTIYWLSCWQLSREHALGRFTESEFT